MTYLPTKPTTAPTTAPTAAATALTDADTLSITQSGAAKSATLLTLKTYVLGSTGSTAGTTGATGGSTGSTGTTVTNSSPVARNSSSTPVPVTALATRTRTPPALTANAAGESPDGTTLIDTNGSITTYDGKTITLQDSGAGLEAFQNGVNLHMKEGVYNYYPFPATRLKWKDHLLCICCNQGGYDDWFICYGPDSSGNWNTCYVAGEDLALTDTFADPVAYSGTQPYPLGVHHGNPDGDRYNRYYDQCTTMFGPILFYNAFNVFNQEWSTWAGAAGGIIGTIKGNPKSAGLLPVIGVKMARNYANFYQNNLGDPTGHDNAAEFRDVINGVHDAHITAVADQWHSSFPITYWRIAYEFNGGFMPDYFGEDATILALWIGAFKKFVNLIRASATAKGVTTYIIWNPNVCQYSANLVTDAWPGDSYVDVIGLDRYSPVYNNNTDSAVLYDWSKNDGKSTNADIVSWIETPENRIVYWDYGGVDQYAKSDPLGNANQFSMQRALAFAQARNKPIMMCETGAGNTHGHELIDYNAADTPSNRRPFRGPVDDPVFPFWLRSRLDQAVNMGIKVLGLLMWVTNESDGGWGCLDISRRREAQAWSAAFGGTTQAAVLTPAGGSNTTTTSGGSTASTGSTSSAGSTSTTTTNLATITITDTSGHTATITLPATPASGNPAFTQNQTGLSLDVYYYADSGNSGQLTIGSSNDNGVSSMAITQNGHNVVSSPGLASKTTITSTTASGGSATAVVADTSGHTATITLPATPASGTPPFYGSDTGLSCDMYYYSLSGQITLGCSASGVVASIKLTRNGNNIIVTNDLLGVTTYA